MVSNSQIHYGVIKLQLCHYGANIIFLKLVGHHHYYNN